MPQDINRACWLRFKAKHFFLLLAGVLTLEKSVCATSVDEMISQAKDNYEQARQTIENYKTKVEALEKNFSADTRADVIAKVCQGRLTAISGTPVPTATSTNARNVYFTPYLGNKISLYYNGQWKIYQFSELSYDLQTIAGSNPNTTFDLFIYASNGTLAIEVGTAWSSATARATNLATQDGVYVKNGDATRRYVGSVRTNGSANERYTDSYTIRGLWNYYNRVPRPMRKTDATNSWTYNGAAFQQAGANAANEVAYLVGINEVLVKVSIMSNVISNDATLRNSSLGLGIDSTTTNSAVLMGGAGSPSTLTPVQTWAEYMGYPGLGYHDLIWLEHCVGCGAGAGQDVTYWGDNGAAGRTRNGIQAMIEG